MTGQDWASRPRRPKLYWFLILVVGGGGFSRRAPPPGGAGAHAPRPPPRLGMRPMHTDEAVHADNFNRAFLERGGYRYDPHEYHGPTLNYFTLIPAWLSGARTYAQLTEATLRIVPVVFGTILVLLTVLLVDGLGFVAVVAAVLAALSPALVFYSRYYIQEMLLVCFTFGLIACGYRYVRSRTLPWAVAAGVFAGLMHATKETSIIAFGSLGLALALMGLAQLGRARSPRRAAGAGKPLHIVLGVAVAMGVSALFYSSFLQHPRGVLDSYLTYVTYLGRGAGENTVHLHPWYYYLQTILYARYFHGPIWTEGAIVLLALVGVTAAVRGHAPGAAGPGWQRHGRRPWRWLRAPKPSGPGPEKSPPVAPLLRESLIGPIDLGLVRFLALYTVTETIVYSAVPYKTPWCLLSFLHGLILLAGVGAAALLAWARKPARRAVVAVLLVLAAGHLAFQAYRANYVYYADSRNPYVYAHTTPEIFTIVAKVKEYVGLHGLGQSDETPIQVAVDRNDYWPLPWYLRGLTVQWGNQIPSKVGPLILISDRLEGALAQRLYEDTPRHERRMYLYLFDAPYYLWFRPGVKMLGFVRKDFRDELPQWQSERSELREGQRGQQDSATADPVRGQ
jgi:uncharacterized protein (TIGR03663 family)